VTDLKRQKQWPSNPRTQLTAATSMTFRCGFEGSGRIREIVSRIEGAFAPLLKAMNERPRGPYRDEWESLFMYMAVQ